MSGGPDSGTLASLSLVEAPKTMVFLWPGALLLLLAVPLLIALYFFLLNRKKHAAVRYASLDLVKNAIGRHAGFRRHAPPALFLIALTALIVAMARPAAFVTLPSERGTIILTMDVSLSMRADDIKPSRMIAAQNAAKSFIRNLPGSTKIGLVAFSSNAFVVQSPTADRDEALAAVDRMRPVRYTAAGSGILTSLKAIFPGGEFEIGEADPSVKRGAALGTAPPEAKEFQPVPPGSYKSAVIVLLSDGQTNVGPDPLEAAQKASERGVRIFTVGFGTLEGTRIRFGGGGGGMLVQLDEDTLKKIADKTGGSYSRAGSELDLKRVYDGITTELVMERQKTELTALFTAAAALIAVLAGLLSLLWTGRLV